MHVQNVMHMQNLMHMQILDFTMHMQNTWIFADAILYSWTCASAFTKIIGSASPHGRVPSHTSKHRRSNLDIIASHYSTNVIFTAKLHL